MEALPQELSASAKYQSDGFIVLPSALEEELARKLASEFESLLPVWAQDCGLPLERYLKVVCKWDHWNPKVASLLETLAPLLRPQVQAVLGSGAWPVGATIFRKSGAAARGTHAHQDLSYAWRPGSQLFRATTWVALTPAAAAPLQVLPGSHRGGLEPAVDFLEPGFADRATAQEWREGAETVELGAGEALLFDGRLWHSSAPCAPGGLRLALAIIWATPGGPDGVPPGKYPRWPLEALPPPALAPAEGFGMDTVGPQLKAALRRLLGASRASEVRNSATGLAKVLLAAPEVLRTLPDPVLAEELLRRYLDFRQAVRSPGAAGQGGMLFEAMHRAIIQPSRRPQMGALVSHAPAEEVKRWLSSWAGEREAVACVVCFGAHGRANPSPTSDLDVCVVGEESLLPQLREDIETELLRGPGFCYVKAHELKLFALIPQLDGTFLRLDCFVVESLVKVERFMLGGGIAAGDLSHAVLHVASPKGEAELEWLKERLLPGPQQQRLKPQVLHGLMTTFIESFEAACSKLAVCDAYQVFFHGFILHDCLIKLEYIRRGGTEFLYLPKHVCEGFPRPVSRRFQHVLAPQLGGGLPPPVLLAACLRQFTETLTACGSVPEVAAALRQAAGLPSLAHLAAPLRRLLASAPPCDVAVGPMLRGRVRCGVGLAAGAGGETTCCEHVLDIREHTEQQWQVGDTDSSSEAVCRHHVPVSFEGATVGSGLAEFGLVLRVLLKLRAETLILCETWQQAGAVVGLMRCIVGAAPAGDIQLALEALGLSNVLPQNSSDGAGSSKAGTTPVHLDPAQLASCCGLDCHELRTLTDWLMARPAPQPSTVNFTFQPGAPQQPCRPYTLSEVALMRRCLLNGCPERKQPTGLLVTGPPASGKSSALGHISKQLGVELDGAVNLDMDGIRKYHADFQRFSHAMDALSESGSSLQLRSFKDLVPWFHAGVDAEGLLYRDQASIMQALLQRRCDFVLPCVLDSPGTVSLVEHVLALGYCVHLAGVHTLPSVAKERARARARATGRWTDGALVDRRAAGVLRTFPGLAALVGGHGGVVALYDNSAEDVAEPRLVYHSAREPRGRPDDARICRSWGLDI